MASNFLPVVVEQTVVPGSISVTADYQATGQQITSAYATSGIKLKNYLSARYGIQYRVDAGAWVNLPANSDIYVAVNLLTQVFRVRKAEFAPTVQIDYDVLSFANNPTVVEGGGNSGLTPAQTAAGATAPVGSSSTGKTIRPDGTLAKLFPLVAKGTVSLLGDSIFANGMFAGRTTSLAIPLWAQSQMEVPIAIMQNYALGGTSSLDLINAQLALAVADSSEMAWVHTGANNNSDTSATARTLAQTATDMRAILNALSPVKKVVIWDALNPCINGPGTQFININRFNALYSTICDEYPNVIFNDTAATFTDPASLVGNPPLAQTTDNVIHPNSWGAKRLGFASEANLRGKLKITPPYNVTGVASAIFQVGTGSGTQTPSASVVYAGAAPPANLTVAATGAGTWTGTNYSNTAGIKSYRLAASGLAASASLSLVTNNDAALAASFVSGDIVRPWWEFRVISQTGLFRVQCGMSVGGTLRSAALAWNATYDTPQRTWPAEAWAGKFYGDAYALPSTPAAMASNLIFFWDANAGGALVMELVAFGIEKVTPA